MIIFIVFSLFYFLIYMYLKLLHSHYPELRSRPSNYVKKEEKEILINAQRKCDLTKMEMST